MNATPELRAHRPADASSTWQTAATWIVGAFFLGFGLLTLETAIAIARGVPSVSLAIMSAIVSHDFTWGGEAGYKDLAPILAQYYQKWGRMVLHTALGGVVVGLGVTQFIPALRRRHPLLHRRTGIVVASSMFLSTAGAVAYLASVTKDTIYSGPIFHVFLWGLAVLAMFLLVQAVLAILSRDFRSHMVWMAACFAAYISAPLLRLDWMVFGSLYSASLQRINASSATVVTVQGLLLMLLWLRFIGDADLPARAAADTSRWPRSILRILGLLSAAVALHEGALASWGLGLGSSLRDTQTILPPGATLWGVTTALAAVWSLGAWDAWVRGHAPSRRFIVALALSGFGAWWAGAQISNATLDGFAWSFFWQCFGAMQLIALALALMVRPNSLGRNAFGVVSLFLLWSPALTFVCAFALSQSDLSANEAIVASATLAIGGMGAAGVATAMGARLRFRPDARRSGSARVNTIRSATSGSAAV